MEQTWTRAIPRDFVLWNKTITLSTDVFFVDGIAFLLTLSHRIRFKTVKHTPSRTAKNLVIHLKSVLRVYHRACFTVQYVLMDGKFGKIKNELASTVCNTMAAKEHVAEAEHQIWVVKERSRGILCTILYEHMPWRMKIEILYFVALWLDTFPVKKSISAVYSPQELITRWKMDYRKHCRVEVGTYCEVHDEPSPSNSTVSRTHERV